MASFTVAQNKCSQQGGNYTTAMTLSPPALCPKLGLGIDPNFKNRFNSNSQDSDSIRSNLDLFMLLKLSFILYFIYIVFSQTAEK